MKLKITGLFAAVLFLAASVVSVPVSAQAIQNPQATLTFEATRTAEGIDYGVYVDHASSLSTLMFAMDFTSQDKGTMSLADNDCFDISHSEWSDESHASLKAYLGRTGQQAGFSSEDKIKVAQISIPIDISEVGEVTATVSGAICAGVPQIDGNAVKGTVTVPESAVRYEIKECSVLSFDRNHANILSSAQRNADVLYAAYDDSGRLISIRKKSVEFNQGKNEISVDGIDFDQSETVSIMIWDRIGSMRSLADKVTIKNQNGD